MTKTINPNENLRKQDTLARAIQNCDEEDAISVRCEACANNGVRLARLVLDLQEWIASGGYLPAKFCKPEQHKCARCGTVYFSEPGYTGIRLCNNKKCEAPVDANPNRQGLAPA